MEPEELRESLVGATIGHFKIERHLASGGMGDVFVASDEKLDRSVALKVLPPEMVADAEHLARFERESKAIAALNHPNIVTIYSVEKVDTPHGPLHFIAMEFVDGEALSARIPDRGLSLQAFLQIAIPLADAISSAHRSGITHRDLKPDNVMIDAEGRVKVLDFGLAKLAPSEVDPDAATLVRTTTVTQRGTVMGTVSYMSPEQSEGQPIDYRSDIFSLGVVFYEMLTGERPFKGDTGMSVISSILKDQPQEITEVKRALPRHLGRIVRRCLQKEPERRYQTALDLRNELEGLKLEAESGVHGASLTAGIRVALRRVDRRLAFWGAAVAAVALCSALVWTLLPVGESASTPESARLERAQAHETLGETLPALALYRQCIDEPASPEEAAVARERLAVLEDGLRPEFGRLVDEGQAAFREGNGATAAELLGRAVKLFPDDRLAWYWLARADALQGHGDAAIEALTLATAGATITADWFAGEEFHALYDDPRFERLVVDAIGEESLDELRAAVASPKPADSGGSVASVSGGGQRAAATGPTRQTGAVGRARPGHGFVLGEPRQTDRWKEARSYVEGYDGKGQTGWRMPTLDELQRICAAGGADLPRQLWAADRRGRQSALYDCHEQRDEGWWSESDVKRARKRDRPVDPYALPVRD